MTIAKADATGRRRNMTLGVSDRETGLLERKAADRHPPRSPFTSKSVLGAGAALLGSGGLWLANPEQGSAASWLQQYAPATTTLAASFLGGYFIGWGAKRTLRVTAVVAAVVLGFVGLLAKFGIDASAMESWINASVGWVGDNLDEAQRYLTAFLPSATAAGAGGVLGFRRT
jgi:uncharacterized membrane protein (Fun14 family)